MSAVCTWWYGGMLSFLQLICRTHKNCLLTQENHAVDHQLPVHEHDWYGQIYSADQQCQMYLGPESYMIRVGFLLDDINEWNIRSASVLVILPLVRLDDLVRCWNRMDRNSIRINDTIQLKISNYVCNRINLILLVPTKLLFVFKWFVLTRWTSSSINMPPLGTARHAATKRSGIWQLEFLVNGWKHSWTFLDWKNSIYLPIHPFSCLSVCLPFPVYVFITCLF